MVVMFMRNKWHDGSFYTFGPSVWFRHTLDPGLDIFHVSDIIMSAMASQITGISIVCSTIRRSKKTSKLRGTGLNLWRNPPVADGFPSQRASNAENVSIWWRHHDFPCIRYALGYVVLCFFCGCNIVGSEHLWSIFPYSSRCVSKIRQTLFTMMHVF